MVIYIFKDTFSSQSIESVCVSDNRLHGLEINTISGGTYEYSFSDDASRDEALQRLRMALTAAHGSKYIDITKQHQPSFKDVLAPKSIDEILNG